MRLAVDTQVQRCTSQRPPCHVVWVWNVKTNMISGLLRKHVLSAETRIGATTFELCCVELPVLA